jgi:hypothetical protein
LALLPPVAADAGPVATAATATASAAARNKHFKPLIGDLPTIDSRSGVAQGGV